LTARLRILVVLLSATLAQATVCSEFRIGGVGVELMLLVTILAGIHGGPERGALVAFWAGLLYDSVTTAPLGLHALVFPSIAMAVSSLERRMLRNTLVTDALAVAAAVATGSAAMAAVGEIFGQASFDPGTLGERILVSALLTTAVAAPVNRVVAWAAAAGLPVTIELRRDQS
jgi:rod shape-determining protein MreD